MNTQASKMELIQMIKDIESSDLIEKVKQLILQNRADFWDDLSDNEKEDIEKGIEDLDNNKRISYNDFLKKGF